MNDINEIPEKGIVVDGSYQKSLNLMQWRVMDLKTKEILYENGLYSKTMYLHNVAEYFALVRGMKYVFDNDLDLIVYSDSQTAISWITNGVNTNIDNPKILKLIKAGEKFVKMMQIFVNCPVVNKWLTKEWSENPCDYGYK